MPWVEVYSLDGVEIERNAGVIPLNEPVNITLVIPKLGLGAAGIGYASIRLESWNEFESITSMVTVSYDAAGEGFSASSYAYRHPPGGGYEELSPFFELNATASTISATDDSYLISFIGLFNSSTTAGKYRVSWQVYDSNNISYNTGLWSSDEIYYYIGDSTEIHFRVGLPDGSLLDENVICFNDEVWLHVYSDQADLELVELRIPVGRSVNVTVNGHWELYPIYIYMIYNSSGVYFKEGYEYWVNEPNHSYLNRVFFDNNSYFTPLGNDTSDLQHIIFKGVFTENLTAGKYDVLLKIKPVGNVAVLLSPDLDSHIYIGGIKSTVSFTYYWDDRPLWGIRQGEELYLLFSFSGPTDYINNITAFSLTFHSYAVKDKIHETLNTSTIYFTYSWENGSCDWLGVYKVYDYDWNLIEQRYYDPFEDVELDYDYYNTMGNVSFAYTGFYMIFSQDTLSAKYYFELSVYNESNPEYSSLNVLSFWGVGVDYKPSASFIIGATLYSNPGESLYPFKFDSQGALDLDGDLNTQDDRYYVLGNYYSLDNWTYNGEGISVLINWFRGNVSLSNILFKVGLLKFNNTYDWANNYYWYHTDWTPVDSWELNYINNTINNLFGYELLKFAVRNMTLDDLIAKGWWWISGNTWQYSWFFFTVDESYLYQTPSITETAQFKADYSALLLFNDTDGDGIPRIGYSANRIDPGEITHYFLIDDVSEIVFQRPFNSSEPSGSMNVSISTPIDFEVFLNNVTGKLYPVKIADKYIYSPYMFYHLPDVNVTLTDFDKTVESASIDQLSFAGHFRVSTGENIESSATLKIDQYIGNWNLTHFDNSVLTNRSLAISYNTLLTTTTIESRFNAENGTVPDPNTNSTASDTYYFGTSDIKLAEIRMGGLNYTWGKDNQVYNAPASTTPLYTFQLMYTTPAEDSLTSFTIQQSMFFLTTGFKHWDGYSINNDPVFSIFPVLEGGEGGEAVLFQWTMIIVSVAVIALISAALFLLKRRRSLP